MMSTSTERTSAGSGGPLHQPQPFQPTNRPGDGGSTSARLLSPARVTQMAKGYTEGFRGVSRPERVQENAGALCVQSRPKPTLRDLHRLVSASIYIKSLTGEPLSLNQATIQHVGTVTFGGASSSNSVVVPAPGTSALQSASRRPEASALCARASVAGEPLRPLRRRRDRDFRSRTES